MDPDRKRHRQRLPPGLRLLVELPQVLRRGDVDGSPIPPHDHQTVVGTVPGAVLRIPGERDGRGDVRPGVRRMVNDLRQRQQIDVPARLHDFLHRPGAHHHRSHRTLHRLEKRPLELTRLGVHGQRHAPPAGVEVGHHRKRAALDVLQQEDGPAAPFPRQLGHQRRHLVDRIHGIGDPDQIILRFDQLEIASEVLRHESPVHERVLWYAHQTISRAKATS